MKNFFALLLALMMCLSLCACGGGGKEETPKMALGETASTDLAEFTLIDSELTYYVSNVSSNYVEPTTEANELFAASIGNCYVSATFTITNKDRGGSISYAGSFAEWSPNWTVSYGDTDYPVKGYDLNMNEGTDSISLQFSAVVDSATGDVIKKHDSMNYLLSAGETVTLRAFGVVNFDPENLTDGFDFTVGVPNSTGEYEYFTYAVPAQS